MFAVWLLVVLSMNLLTGYSGQISLGHAALVAVGAYITAILFDQYSFPLGLAVLVAGIATGVMGGVIIGVPAVRLTGPYLAIATFSLIIALPQLLKMDIEVAGLGIDVTGWTGGPNGIRISELQPLGFADGFVDQRQWLYYVSMLSAVIMTFLAWNLIRSRIGRAFVALRDSEVGAEQMGVNVRLYKALAFGISSGYAGIGGGLFFMVQANISPGSMDLQTSINFLIAIVIGGLATIFGSIIGAIYLTFQSELISNVAPRIAQVVPSQIFQEPDTSLRGVIFGSILILTIITFPRGLAGAVYSLLRWSPAKVEWPPDVRQWLGRMQIARTFLPSKWLNQGADPKGRERDVKTDSTHHQDEGRG
jgi:branched-chain amino acid transport system permease protein